MQTAAEEQVTQDPPPYEMPKTKVGRMVWWFAPGDRSRPTAAIVTKVGFNAISVNIIMEDRGGFRSVSGVRHISDPEARNQNFEAFGTWDETDDTKLILKIAESLL